MPYVTFDTNFCPWCGKRVLLREHVPLDELSKVLEIAARRIIENRHHPEKA